LDSALQGLSARSVSHEWSIFHLEKYIKIVIFYCNKLELHFLLY
jgi:hypothetical protein